MAGPQNNFNAAMADIEVYDSVTGESLITARLNAIDLVRAGSHRWKKEDIGRARPEAEGPADPSAELIVVYDAKGAALETTPANARELVGTGAYTWTDPNEVKSEEEKAAEAVVAAAEAVAETEAAIAAEAIEGEESLTEEAKRVTGDNDVAKYLEGFSLEALKQIAEERFGEKVHHRASKETAIMKIVELEEAAQIQA